MVEGKYVVESAGEREEKSLLLSGLVGFLSQPNGAIDRRKRKIIFIVSFINYELFNKIQFVLPEKHEL
ncbi:hypothetical protein ACFL50_06885 [Candidatus Latescibacterota bacterium]